MDSGIVQRLRARIAELAAERDQVQRDAERRLFGYAAVMGELEQLLGTLAAELPTTEEGEANAAVS